MAAAGMDGGRDCLARPIEPKIGDPNIESIKDG